MLALLDRLSDAPGWIMTDLHEVLVQNAMATALLGRPPAAEGMRASGIFRWFTEPELSRVHYPAEDHADRSAWLVAELRAASRRRPGDAGVQALAEALIRESAEVAQLWARGDMDAQSPDLVRILHPAIGLVELDCARLATDDERAHLVWCTPVTGTPAAIQLPMLGLINPLAARRDRSDRGLGRG
jgi:hypothetical protein